MPLWPYYCWSGECLETCATTDDIKNYAQPVDEIHGCCNKTCIVDGTHQYDILGTVLEFFLSAWWWSIMHWCSFWLGHWKIFVWLSGWERWSWWCHHFANTCHQPTAVPRLVWFRPFILFTRCCNDKMQAWNGHEGWQRKFLIFRV